MTSSPGADPLFALWTYLSASPLLWLAATLWAYLAGTWVQRQSGQAAAASPVLFAVVVLIAVLAVTGTPYARYFEGAQFVHFLLGPATVALAVPLVRQIGQVRRALPAVVIATVGGSLIACLSAYGFSLALGGSEVMARSLAPKAVTTPVAMAVAEEIGGLSSLTAAVVIVNGILGAMVVTGLMNRAGIRDWRARGFAAGLAASGIGTARAMHVHPQAGAFAALALGLNALATALILPVLIRLFG